MSEVKAEICTIKDIQNHANADSLEIATVMGWNCVIKKNSFKAGDKCVYIPIDACIPPAVENMVFKNAKVKLTNGRIKTIRLRGVVSQGLVVDPELVGLGKKTVGTDVTADLGITKYEPPAPGFQSFGGKRAMPRKQNDNFKKYTSIENGKKYTEVFPDDEVVVITEKLHGTNFRAGWVKRPLKNVFKRIWAAIKKDYAWEFIVGSHNIQLKETANNLYCDIAKKYSLKEKVPKSEVVYGEIVGPNIQKGYSYGLSENELVVFDIMKTVASDGMPYERYKDFHDVQLQCKEMGVKTVPVLATCTWGQVKMENYLPAEFIGGDSVFNPDQKVREGVVIRAIQETGCRIGRMMIKYINPEYLLEDNTDFH